MSLSRVPVSIGLPVRNGGDDLESVIRSVLDQDFENLEFVISDNVSTDNTEEICRQFARVDSRIVYVRQPEPLTHIDNFLATVGLASGEFFRWIGDDDALAPQYVSKCLREFESDRRLFLVSTQIAYTEADGQTHTAAQDSTEMLSDDPAERFIEILRLLNTSHLVIDPLYSVMRREMLAKISFRNILGGDEVFATKLALAGPWGHVPEVLASRFWKQQRKAKQAAGLQVPRWHAPVSLAVMCQELLRVISDSDLEPLQRRRAKAAVARFYLRRHQLIALRRGRTLAYLAKTSAMPRRGGRTTGPTRGARAGMRPGDSTDVARSGESATPNGQ